MLANITFIGGGQVDPGYGVSAPPPGAVQLPVFPFDPTRPDQGLPSGGHVDNSLPVPGKRYVVRWLACHGLILVPDNSLPGQSGRPDQGLPGSQPHPDQGLPAPPTYPSQGLPGSQPKPDQGLPGQPGRPDQGLPPTAQPKK